MENLGVFDYTELLGQFDNHTAADAYLRDLQENSSYVPVYQDELRITEVPENYDSWRRLLDGLRRSMDKDLRIEQAMARLLALQEEARRASS